MKRVLLLVLAGLLICLQSDSSIVTVPFGAKDKTINDFPYVGGFLNKDGLASSAVVLKGGKFAITAKHSVTIDGSIDGEISSISDLFYVIREDGKSTLCKVMSVHPHPELDIAIVELAEPLSFGAKTRTDVVNGEIFYGVGYGMTSGNSDEYPPKFDKYDAKKKVFRNRLMIEGDSLSFDLSKKETLGQDGGAITGEGMIGMGDSGGGMFVEYHGELFLVGILESSTMNSDSDGNVFLLGSGVWVNAECNKWIESIVEPNNGRNKK